MKKLWNEYIQNQPKAQPNWDRNAPRPMPPAKPNTSKKKPKVKQKSKHRKKPEPVPFENVEFKTPPLTPPVAKLEPVKSEVKKDNEFWDFYDKGK
jgi:hypothetical protein